MIKSFTNAVKEMAQRKECDYDVDWTMPYDEETGDVWDTDITVYLNDNHKETIDWLINQFMEMKNTLPCWKMEVAV